MLITPAVPADLKGALQMMAVLKIGFLNTNASGWDGIDAGRCQKATLGFQPCYTSE